MPWKLNGWLMIESLFNKGFLGVSRCASGMTDKKKIPEKEL